MYLAIKVTYHKDYITWCFLHQWHMVFCSNVLKYPHNIQSFLPSWLLQKLTQLWSNETQNRDTVLVIIDSPNWVQGSQGKVRDTQNDTRKDLVDPKLLCDQSGRHFGLSFPSSVAVFENLCTKMISLSMFYHIILRRSLLRQFKSLVRQYNYYAYFYTKVRESKIAWFWKKQRLQSRSVWSGIKLIKCPNPYMVINNILIVYKGSFFDDLWFCGAIKQKLRPLV